MSTRWAIALTLLVGASAVWWFAHERHPNSGDSASGPQTMTGNADGVRQAIVAPPMPPIPTPRPEPPKDEAKVTLARQLSNQLFAEARARKSWTADDTTRCAEILRDVPSVVALEVESARQLLVMEIVNAQQQQTGN